MENSNTSFDKLLELQKILKEEIVVSDSISENRSELLKKLDNICLNYYKKRISIQEIYDNIKIDVDKKKKYEITQTIGSDYISPFKSFLLYLRNSMDLTLKIAQNCPQESSELLASFIFNNYDSGVISSFILNENLLTLICLLLQKEIDKLNAPQISDEFLEPSKSFCGTLLKYLCRSDEVKSYLENVLKKVLIELSGLLPNQKNRMFIGFEVEKIYNFLKKDKCSLSRTQKKNKDYNDLLTKDIKKSRMNMKFLKCLKEEETENELNEKEISNNFYIQKNRDYFDNLLLGNLEEINEIKILYEQNSENILLNFEDKKGGKNDFETFLLNSYFFFVKKQKEKEKNLEEKEALIREEEIKFIESNRDKLFNDLYNKDLNRESLLDCIKEIEEQSQQSHSIIEEYIKSKIDTIGDKKNFSNDNIIKEISKVSKSQDFIERFILIYKYHFEVIRKFADELITSLISNTKNTPYVIRAICAIIFRLIEKKFPQMTNSQKVLFVSKFFFSDLIIPILLNPEFNGIMPYNFDDKAENLRNLKLNVLIEIIKKVFKDELFDSSKKGEENYTIFNPYLIEVMPHIIEFFQNLSSAELPNNILSLINGGNNIEYKFLEVHPEEKIEYQSICINWEEYIEIYKIIKLNPTFYLPNNESTEFKSFSKLILHEKLLYKNIENDEQNSKKTYVHFFNENSFKNETNKIMANKKEDSSTNENQILRKIKDYFYIILKNLNTLSKNNFKGDESIEDIIKGLNNTINKEDINGTLIESAIPLNWYGTYLQSYIDKIPSDYKDNNYSKLYDELINEHIKNLDNYKKDESLDILYNKVANGENMIEMSQNFLEKLKSDQKKLDILHFILTKQIPIIIKIYRNKEEKISLIEFMKPEEKSNSKGEKSTKIKCNYIFEFCDSFPDLTKEENIPDLFKFEDEIKLKDSLNQYFNIIYENLKEANLFEGCQKEEETTFKIKIQDLIFEQIYDKIYPSDFKEEVDTKILTNCITHKWIEPKNLDENLINLDDKIIQMMRPFVRKINENKSPNNKLKEFEKLDFIINNIILLHGYPKDTYLNIMCLPFIKEQTYKIYKLDSLYKYIKMFYYKEKENEIINEFEHLKNKLYKFSFQDVVTNQLQRDVPKIRSIRDLENDEVKIKIIDKESSTFTRGHRFAQQNIPIGNPEDYIETMRNACVIVDQNERRELIIKKAKEEGISVLAISDHDTVTGLEEGRNAAREAGIEFINGIEINIQWTHGEFHLLGLGLKDEIHEDLADIIKKLSSARRDRNIKIVQKMNVAGIEGTIEELENMYQTKSLGRPHLADFLVQRKIVRHKQDAFDKYLAHSRPFYVEKEGADLDMAVDAIIASGGVPVIAHPLSLYLSWSKLEPVLRDIKKRGVKGLEAWHPGAREMSCLLRAAWRSA